MLRHRKDIAGSRRRVLGSLLLIVSIVLAWGMAPAWAENDRPIVKVMTQNMDAGTDLLWFFAVDPPTAIQKTYEELQTNRFKGRAIKLALEIALERPDLISLQEVTLWQTISLTTGPHDLADQLDLLMDALALFRQHYVVAASQDLTDITVPLTATSYFRFLDRNVVLARADCRPSEFSLSNVKTGIYQAKIAPIVSLPTFVQLNGWISTDVKMRDKSFRFFNTHLESPVAVDDYTQMNQGIELIQIMSASKLPVILAGDFNSDASGLGLGPDLTPTAGYFVDAGYTDVWKVRHNASQGLTWPLFREDMYAGTPARPTERIDLIFARHMRVLDVDRIGVIPPYASDHAGVVATLMIDF